MTARRQQLTHFFGISLSIIGIAFSSRFAIDASTRLFFTFVPQLASGLGATLTGFGWLMFWRAVAGITGPVFGLAADRIGRRRIMAAALLAQGLATGGLALARGWWGLLPMCLSGLSLAAFIPAQQAYISELAVPQRRGRVMGIVELSWSLTALFASPVMGWLIKVIGWRAPLLLLSAAYGVGTAVVMRLPPAPGRQTVSKAARPGIGRLLRRKNVAASVLVAFLVYVGVTCFLTITGVWLDADFGMDAAAIGLVSTLVGIAELAGAGASSLLIDWLGKRRGNVTGLFLLAVAFAIIPVLPPVAATAVAGLALLGMLFQFVIVSLIPLYAEQADDARGTALALIYAGVGIGAGVGPPLTALLWQRYRIPGVAAAGATCLFVALVMVQRYMIETPVRPTAATP